MGRKRAVEEDIKQVKWVVEEYSTDDMDLEIAMAYLEEVIWTSNHFFTWERNTLIEKVSLVYGGQIPILHLAVLIERALRHALPDDTETFLSSLAEPGIGHRRSTSTERNPCAEIVGESVEENYLWIQTPLTPKEIEFLAPYEKQMKEFYEQVASHSADTSKRNRRRSDRKATRSPR